MSKKTIRVIAIVLAAIMLMSVAIMAVDILTGSASANTATTREQINRLRQELAEYQRRKREIQATINAIDFNMLTEVARKNVLDDRIILTGLEIENVEATIVQYELLIVEKEREVERALERENYQLQRYRTRVRDMEENGVITYLEILFDSTSFADLLARIDFVSDIMRADERTYFALIDARNETIAARYALEETKVELEGEQTLLEEMRAELEEQIAYADNLIYQLQQERDTEAAIYAEVTADEARILRDIRAREEELRRQEAAAAARRQQQNIVRGTGSLRWPVPGFYQVTSGFGVRMHPVFRVMRQHSGIDIAGPGINGANVVAADRGTVITSAFNSSFGNFIVIAHGENANGERITTLYAHLQSRAVSQGQVVEQGQVIGRVGSTGVSTGPHLHFEVTVNGARVNPRRFV